MTTAGDFNARVVGLTLAHVRGIMSFIARRFGSAGFVADDDRNADRGSGITLKGSMPRERHDRESGIVLSREPFVLAVGVDDETAALCTEAAKDADIGFLRVAHGPAACRKIPENLPTIVAVTARLWADERNAIAEIAHSIGACVVELPHGTSPTSQTVMLMRAALGVPPASAVTGCSFKATA